MKKLIIDWFKGPGNKYWDLVRPLVVIAFILFNVFQYWSLSAGQPFNAMSYGGGISAFLALIAVDRFSNNRFGMMGMNTMPMGQVQHRE